jgi:hypothetical protein
MQVVNFTEARNNLKAICDTVYADSEEVIIIMPPKIKTVKSNLIFQSDIIKMIR